MPSRFNHGANITRSALQSFTNLIAEAFQIKKYAMVQNPL